ncbi:MAG TPA: dihydrofolate reductase family protein [Thermoleophilaceae bacterium]
MGRLTFEISMSVDGYVAGPNADLEDPLGQGGELLHEWIFGTQAWRESHGEEGGVHDADSELVAEAIANRGATIMGRRMFSGGEGPWEQDPNASGWWGDDPPFRHPVFILTHHEREPVEFPNGTSFNFVTGGIEAALEQARAAAGDKDVGIGGGADVAQQYLRAGLIDEMTLHVVPRLMGAGVRLFDGHLSGGGPQLERTRVLDSPNVTHLRYRVVK